MNHNSNFNIFDFLRYIQYSYLPNKKDNFKQAFIKIVFLISLVAFIVSVVYISGFFIIAEHNENLLEANRQIWYQNFEETEKTDDEEVYVDENSPQVTLMRKNPDFKGWITISNTKIDNPIYQTYDNEYYLDHNQDKKSSVYGALFFDYRNEISRDKIDKNLVVYGHEMKNGKMFGELKKLRSLDFYKNNPTIEFSTIYEKSTYKIYAVFVLNSSKEDDGGYIYNILGQDFVTEDGFNSWVNQAKERSLINTNVDVKLGDDTLTLVTCCDDFTNARLVVMARKTRDGESILVETENAVLNPNPKYPKRWYKERNLDYPF